MSIKNNLAELLENIEKHAHQCKRDPKEIALVAVSKGKSDREIMEAYQAGMKDFGESRMQEVLGKMEKLPKDIRWHYIGKLQKNKVSKAVGKFVLIHSVDTPELAEKISKASLLEGEVTNILLESNTSKESSKGGLSLEEWESVLEGLLVLKGIEIKGLMTIAPLTEDESAIRRAFEELRLQKERLQLIAGERAKFTTLSMGMSNDYSLAIEEGATLLRIGTAIFTPHGSLRDIGKTEN